jgi:phosphate:Na+ symporter
MFWINLFELFDYWKFLAGLGIFLFGMFLIEESIRKISGPAFRTFLQKSTDGRVKSIFYGAGATAVLQSSFAVSLMTLAFVHARVLTMENALGVVIGSNFGTTMTAWIVASFGFKLNIESFALPMIGLGGIGTIFLGKSERYSNLSKLVSGFGFLFMGLDFMKLSVLNLTNQIDITLIPHYGNFIYLVLGLLLTAMMMSSSASLAIAMTAFHGGLLDFTAGCAFFIGANLGNVLPLVLTSIGGSSVRKRIVAGHFFFNLYAGIAAFLTLPLVDLGIDHFHISRESQVQGLAFFHTLFNGLGIIILAPNLGRFTNFLNKLFPESKVSKTYYLTTNQSIHPEGGLISIQRETKRYLFLVLYHNYLCLMGKNKVKNAFNFFPSDFHINPETNPEDLYSLLRSIHVEISSYASKLQEQELTRSQSEDLSLCLRASQNLLFSAKYITYLLEDWKELEESGIDFITGEISTFQKDFHRFTIPIIENWNSPDPTQVKQHIIREGIAWEENQEKFSKRIHKGLGSQEIPKNYFTTVLNVYRAMSQSQNYLSEAIQDILSRNESYT